MKPEVGGAGEMAQEEFDPLDLLSKVAILVLEARTPHPSAKGRVEGPHCAVSRQPLQHHQCVAHKQECKRAQDAQQRIKVLWRNGIPSCMDILLFPKCAHGKLEASSLDGSVGDEVENCLLLERWSLKHIQKWHGGWEQGVAGGMLLQAVRSYLYFSQLSSWLASLNGSLPAHIAYRLYAPGEYRNVDFEQQPQVHDFPCAVYGPHGLKVTVHSLPRRSYFPDLPCWLAGGPSGFLALAGDGIRVDGPLTERGAKDQGQASAICASKSGRKKSSSGSPPQDRKGNSGARFKRHHTEHQSVKDQQTSKMVEALLPGVSDSQGKQTHTQLKTKAKRSSSRDTLENQLRPLELSSPFATHNVDLHSPKVLMSDAQYNPVPSSVKKHLDFDRPPPTGHSDSWLKEEQQFLVKHYMKGGDHSPLSPLDISAFLTNLRALSEPCPKPEADLSRHPLIYRFLAEQAGDAEFAQFFQSAHLKKLEGLATKPSPQSSSDLPDARFRKKRALPYGGDPVPKGSLEFSSSASSSKNRHTSTRPMSPKSQDTQCYRKKLPFCLSESMAGDTPIVKPAGEWKGKRGKKKSNAEDDATTEHLAEVSAVIEEMTKSVMQKGQKPGLDELFAHPRPLLSSDPIEHTMRGLGKLSRPRKRKRRRAKSVPDLWSSSSSSSSLTDSSLPKPSTESLLPKPSTDSYLLKPSAESSLPKHLKDSVLPKSSTDIDGDRHSDSSTPTNLSTSPVPDEILPASCHSSHLSNVSAQRKPVAASSYHFASVCPHCGENLFTGSSFCGTHLQDLTEKHNQPCSKGDEISENEAVTANCCQNNLVNQLEDFSKKPHLKTASSARSLEQQWPPTLQHRKSSPVGSTADCADQRQTPIFYDCKEGDLTVVIPALDRVENGVLDTSSVDESVREHEDPLLKFYLGPSTCDGEDTGEDQRDTIDELDNRSLLVGFDKLHIQSVEEGSAFHPCHCRPDEPSSVDVFHSNGSALVDSIPSTRCRDPSKDCLVCGSVEAPKKTPNGCVDQKTASMHSTLLKDNSFHQVSISNSSVGTCLENPTCQNEQNGKNFNETYSSEFCAEKSATYQGQPHSDGLMQVEEKPISDTEEDSVFYDKANEGVDRSAAVVHCPMRTKSAPNISCLSDNMKIKTRTESDDNLSEEAMRRRGRSALREKDGGKVLGPERLRHRLVKSASLLFNSRGSLPSQSSPAPVKRRSSGRFDYDETLTSTKAIKSAISLSRLPDLGKDSSDLWQQQGTLSTSAPASTNCLLGNFEESVLNGRLEPAGIVEGFSVDIGAAGDFCPRHISLPVTAYFFNLSDDNAPSPYLGHINLEEVGRRGYHIPNTGTMQVTLFNPNKTVVKMFVVKYDLEDMPANSQTVIRQRTIYTPLHPDSHLPSYLRYLIHLRIASSSSKKIYLHTDIRLIFARNKFELDGTVAQYELRSYTETPVNPKYSPKR